MRFFKERLGIESLMLQNAKAIMRRDPRTALGEILVSDVLSESDKQSLLVELRIFEVAVHLLLLIEICANRLDMEKVSYLWSKSVVLAAYSVAIDGNNEAAQADPMRLTENAISYLGSAIERRDARPRDVPLTFYYCQEFVRRVHGDHDIIDMGAQAQRGEIFNVAKQILRNAESFLDAIQKDYKITF